MHGSHAVGEASTLPASEGPTYDPASLCWCMDVGLHTLPSRMLSGATCAPGLSLHRPGAFGRLWSACLTLGRSQLASE